ncbi:glycine betaine/proline transport system substrate-binding protein [Salsuginibacillus halophilus]|uniref:Glycine betaine/proline transport system substrate-binding protein n=1 Tax=Salsuginibacillus halophilus TaxID=517424 RepID=A0A2P8H8L7_9BACI|nr:glycine betaine ABC transporter substrate-binding protein [Salsuginibacillus halophilus]PSL42576.1 glycine betaine/proline transport system substrate-binding protein [Salsuginibacillus halophilus]
MKKSVLTLVTTSAVLAALTACGENEDVDGLSDEVDDGDDNGGQEEIAFGVTPWTSTVPPTEVAAIVVEEMGYDTAQTEADAGNVYTGLSGGDLDVFMDGWFPVHDNYIEQYEDTIEKTALSYDDAEAGWVVPEYMDDIDSIEDIQGEEDSFGNEFYGIEEGASVTEVNDDVIEEYELDMTQVNSSEGGMIAESMRLMESEEPVAFYGWRPHSKFYELDIKIIDDDRGFFDDDEVHVVTNNELADQAPDVYEFLSNWSMDIDEIESMIVEIEEEGRDAREVAEEWVEENRDEIDEMIPEDE